MTAPVLCFRCGARVEGERCACLARAESAVEQGGATDEMQARRAGSPSPGAEHWADAVAYVNGAAGEPTVATSGEEAGTFYLGPEKTRGMSAEDLRKAMLALEWERSIGLDVKHRDPDPEGGAA